MQNILVSGGAGFIGINLIQYLLEKDAVNKIIVVDNFITSSKTRFMKFKSKYSDDQILLFEADICNIDLRTELIKLSIHTIDQIYHLASLASPTAYKMFPIETLNVGYVGTKYLLHLATLYNSKILFASTSEVYGDALLSPQDEGYYGNVNPFGARSCYDESKRIGEALCYTYHTKYGVNVKIARIFNTYGPYMLLDDGRIITEVIKNLKNKSILTVYGDGTQTRSYCYVADTVAMLVKLMDSAVNIPVNIGNDTDEKTVNDTAKCIQDIWNDMYGDNNTVHIVYQDLTQNDPLQRRPCLKLNRQLLGEHKYTTFEDGIKKTIEHFV